MLIRPVMLDVIAETVCDLCDAKMYEFTNNRARRCPHNVIDPVKITQYRTQLKCVRCNAVVGEWIDIKDVNGKMNKIYGIPRPKMDYTDEQKEELR